MSTKTKHSPKARTPKAAKGKGAKAAPAPTADDRTPLDATGRDENGFPLTYADPEPATTPEVEPAAETAQPASEPQTESASDAPAIGDHPASSGDSGAEPETFPLVEPTVTMSETPEPSPASEPAPEPVPAAETTVTVSPIDESKIAGLDLHLLVYDIPSKADVYNPSWFLRRRGFRVNLSCWVLPAAKIPYTELAELTEAKVRWRVFRFDAGEAPALVAEALRVIRAEVAEAVARARDSAAKMTAKHLEGAEHLQDEDAEPRTEADRLESYEAAAYRIVGRMEELLDDVKVAVEGFGIHPDAVGIGGAVAAVEAIQAKMNAKAEAYKKAMEALKAAGQTELAKAGAETEVPGFAVADALQEAGVDPDTANAIGNAVDNPVPAAAGTLTPAVPPPPAA